MARAHMYCRSRWALSGAPRTEVDRKDTQDMIADPIHQLGVVVGRSSASINPVGWNCDNEDTAEAEERSVRGHRPYIHCPLIVLSIKRTLK